MTTTIRMAREADAGAIRAIYAPFCTTTSVSFELEPPSADEIASRVRALTAGYPWLVLEDEGAVAGYAYAGRHSERAAYGWSVDATVYVAAGHLRRGVGRALYTALFELLRQQGFFKAYAVIALPNPASIALHEAMGFERVGVYKGVGYKLGAWRDVAHFQLALRPEQLDPEPPVPPAMLVDTAGWRDAVSRGLRHYRKP
jgi:L-amino acid N-acyltransferase YncA